MALPWLDFSANASFNLFPTIAWAYLHADRRALICCFAGFGGLRGLRCSGLSSSHSPLDARQKSSTKHELSCICNLWYRSGLRVRREGDLPSQAMRGVWDIDFCHGHFDYQHRFVKGVWAEESLRLPYLDFCCLDTGCGTIQALMVMIKMMMMMMMEMSLFHISHKLICISWIYIYLDHHPLPSIWEFSLFSYIFNSNIQHLSIQINITISTY